MRPVLGSEASTDHDKRDADDDGDDEVKREIDTEENQCDCEGKLCSCCKFG